MSKSTPKKISKLGRSLDILLPEFAEHSALGESSQGVLTVEIDSICASSYQPRHEFDPTELAELASSIDAQGILSPLLVRKFTNGKFKYELIAGERRLRAAKLAGLTSVPILIKQMNDEQAACVALIENTQRTDLNPIEKALGIQKLIEQHQLSQTDVAKQLAIARPTLTNLLRILELEDYIINLLRTGKISLGHAKVILSAPNNQRLALAKKIVALNLSVKQTEALLAKLSITDKPKKAPRVIHPDTKELTDNLSKHCGFNIGIKQSASGKKGSLLINFRNLDDLDKIITKLFTIKKQ